MKRIKQLIEEWKQLNDAIHKATLEAKKIEKQNKDLLAKINTAKKQSGVLLLEDLNEDLIKKLQSLTEDNVIVIFLKDGQRMEIRKDSTNYKRDRGAIR